MRGRKMEDLKGREFNKLQVESFIEIKDGKALWLCKCKCGNKKTVWGYLLKANRTRSCGCLRAGQQYYKRWSGVGDLSGTMFNNIKVRARKRGLDFDVTKEYLWDLFCKQDKRCALSGLPISFSKSWSSDRKKRNNLTTASLDRIDSSKGYTKDNVQWVHQDLNTMKMDIPQDEFINICIMVAEKFSMKGTNNGN